MDSLISAAGRALRSGDAVSALKHVGTRADPPALALRGIAMAQLGLHARARELLRQAARAFGPKERIARARCIVAEAEVALAMRDLGIAQRPLAAAGGLLEEQGDRQNAALARLIAARRALLLGHMIDAESALAVLDSTALSPSSTVVAELVRAEIAMRRLRIADARQCLMRARGAAARIGIAALAAEVGAAEEQLDRPAARRTRLGHESQVGLEEVATLYGSDHLIVDACRRGVRSGSVWVPLQRRPVLFAIANALAEAAPGDVDRHALIEAVFRIRRADETHRARLRVEIGRLRKALAGVARIEPTPRGFALHARNDQPIVLLRPPIDGEEASLLALLADGAAWSTSALALATGVSQRTVQRSLADLERQGRVRSVRRARAQRWLAPPLTQFTTILLLPAAYPLA